MARPTRVAAGLAAGALLLSGCAFDAAAKEADRSSRRDQSRHPPEPRIADLDIALSEPREDSYYPEVGDPGVDALHYALDLTLGPRGPAAGRPELLTFRATETADEFQLDFGEPLEIEELLVDGEPADYEKVGKDLVVSHPVRADQRYELEISYAGTPEPVEVPVQRVATSTETGWTITRSGETWTMQEPFGAFTWYAVNDHPSDKALYDFTLTVPAPWTGVANGELLEVSEADGLRTTIWHLAEPAASYLVTTAFGDFDMTRDESESGVPITYWTPRSDPDTLDALGHTPAAMAWLEDLLGPYPFDTFGTVVVDSASGMETQTMVTLGDTAYTLSPRGDRARARAPVVRRPGDPHRLARPLDERGHGDVPPGHVGGRAGGHHGRARRWTSGPPTSGSSAPRPVPRRRSSPTPSAARTSTTDPR